MINWSSREKKVVARERFFGEVPFISTNYLTLAGSDCADVILALEKGIINRHTKLTIVERVPEIYLKIKEWIDTNWAGEDYRVELNELCNIHDLDSIDLAYLDYLGNLTEKDAIWAKQHLSKSMTQQAIVGVTVTSGYRNNQFVPKLAKLLENKFDEEFYEVRKRIAREDINSNIIKILSAYIMLFHHYVFDNVKKITFHSYKEDNSRHRMVLMVIFLGNTIQSTESEVGQEIGLLLKTPVPVCEVREMQASEVVDKICSAKTAGQKAAATRARNCYVEARCKETGSKPDRVIAALNAAVTRRKNNGG